MIDLEQKQYYYEMLINQRLLPFLYNNKTFACITFYIGTIQNANKYVRDNMWEILSDEPLLGTVCYIDQYISDHSDISKYNVFWVWNTFKKYIKMQFPQVDIIRWNRYKGGKRYVYIKEVR